MCIKYTQIVEHSTNSKKVELWFKDIKWERKNVRDYSLHKWKCAREITGLANIDRCCYISIAMGLIS